MEYHRDIAIDRPLNWQDAEIEPFPFELDELLAANEQMSKRTVLAGGGIGGIQLDREAVFSNFGLMLGIFPPATFFLAFLFKAGSVSPFIVAMLLLTNLTTALVGRGFGKVVARMVTSAEKRPLGEYGVLAVLIGALWGLVAGGAGGLFIFLVGGFFGAAIGALVGAIALPAFLLPYSTVEQGGSVGLSHFLPMSVGVTSVICAYILHMLAF